MPPSDSLPLQAPLPVHDPLEALRRLRGLPHPFLLHSGMALDGARWSFFGADPFAVHRADYQAAIASWRTHAREAQAEAQARAAQAAPFTGGVVGYWAYDFGRRLERVPAIAHDDLGLPDFLLGFYDVVGAWDHAAGRGWLFSSGLPARGPERAARARQRLEAFAARLAITAPAMERPAPWTEPRAAVSTFAPEDYRRAVEAVQDHIRRGDIFQANLSQRWTLPLPSDGIAAAPALHEALARLSPAPWSAYLDAGDHAVVSASPERFLELRGREVQTRPIKGTRPRGRDADEDRRLAEALLASAKDRAENVMIVDVLRNDLGRVCATGSVETRSLCALETFPHVHHLTSTVTGRLAGGLDAFDLLHACFPGGSITGAPKIRAMEILERLEPVRRHLYTGAIGYVDWRGDADWNIAIRTALLTPDALHFAAGGGITADSNPDAELQETLDKAEGLRLAASAVFGPVRLDAGAAVPR